MPEPEAKATNPMNPLGPLGGAVGGSAVGLGIGLSLGNGQLPIKTFEWVLDKGVAGLLLVVAFVLGHLYLSEKKAREVEKERLYRELIDTVGSVREALTHATTALEQANDTIKLLRESHGGSP